MQQSNRTEGLDMGRAKQRKTAGQHLTDSEVFQASIALAETVSTDGVLDSDKWEALMRYMGLRDGGRDDHGRPRPRRMRHRNGSRRGARPSTMRRGRGSSRVIDFFTRPVSVPCSWSDA